MDLSIYDLLQRMLQPGERIQWVSFHPTLSLELDKVNGRRVPYDQRMKPAAAKTFLENMKHGKSTPKIRVYTDLRQLCVSPSPLVIELWHDHGTITSITFAVSADQELEASQPGASA